MNETGLGRKATLIMLIAIAAIVVVPWLLGDALSRLVDFGPTPYVTYTKWGTGVVVIVAAVVVGWIWKAVHSLVVDALRLRR